MFILNIQIFDINPPMATGGGEDAGFQFFPRMGRPFFANQIFSCRLILGTSVHEKIFQIGPTVLALKLDKGRVLGGGGVATTPMDYFSNHEDDIQS